MSPTKRNRPKRTKSKPDESLSEYRRKRDFTRTREPAGDAGRSSRGKLQFVIQKHAASHLHYDLRLELDGVMRSWAVPKGPSLDPAVKRLAMQVEDHPMEYNTFEGTIPKGEYGGGTVMLWDRGTYTPDETKSAEDHEDAVRRGLRAGKLSFTFHGERLRGSFALVRTQRGEKPKWLLIKHRDCDADAGEDITERVFTSVATGRTMQEIATGADRVWRSNRGGHHGGEESAVHEPDGNVPDIAPMRPTPVRTLPVDGDWLYEPWHGGERVLAYVTPDAARILSGTSDVTRSARDIAGQLSALARRAGRAFVLEGELSDDDGDTRLFASDLLLDGADVLLGDRFEKRRAALEKLFARRRVKGVRIQECVRDPELLLRDSKTHGRAGMIARRVDASYEPGVRSDAMLRIASR